MRAASVHGRAEIRATTKPCLRGTCDASFRPAPKLEGDSMLRAFVFGLSASLTLAFAASGAEAKAPQCKDAKGHAAPCPQKSAPAPQPAGGGGGGCLWLLASGYLVPCFVQ